MELTRELILENVDVLEVHRYSPEQNKLKFKNSRITIPAKGLFTVEEAADYILDTPTLTNKTSLIIFGIDYTRYKILSGKVLLEEECENFAHEDSLGEEVDRDIGENRRWSRTVTIVRKVEERYFEMSYEQGLTEYQPSSYPMQPFEVERTEKEVTVTQVYYTKKK